MQQSATPELLALQAALRGRSRFSAPGAAPHRRATPGGEPPPALARAIDRCLAKDPADRYPDGESLAAALDLSGTARRTAPLLARLAGELSSFSADLSNYGTLAATVLLAQTLTASHDFR